MKTTSAGTVLAVPPSEIQNSFDASSGKGEATYSINDAALNTGRRSLHTVVHNQDGTTTVTDPVGELMVSVTVVGFDSTPCSASATKSFTFDKLQRKD